MSELTMKEWIREKIILRYLQGKMSQKWMLRLYWLFQLREGR